MDICIKCVIIREVGEKENDCIEETGRVCICVFVEIIFFPMIPLNDTVFYEKMNLRGLASR